MEYILLIILISVVLEIKFKPRIETVETDFYKSFLVFYTIKSNYNTYSREFFELFKMNK